MTHKISVLNDIHLLPEAKAAISELAGGEVVFPDDTPAETELLGRTGDAEVMLMSPGTKISAQYLEACPTVKYVCLCGTSAAGIDLKAVSERGIAFTNVVDYGDEPTAEFIFMQLVTLARGTGKYHWRDEPCELMGKSITIIGLGAVGKAVARLALSYKMQVSYNSVTRKPDWEEQGLHYGELAELLPASDIVVTSVPTDTKVLGASEFGLMKAGSVLVQASMGETFEKEAFEEWIGRDGNFAIFDNAAGEDNRKAYEKLSRVVFPRVTSGYTRESKERLGQKVVENLKAYFEHGK